MIWYVNYLFSTQYELDIPVRASRKRLLSSSVSVLMSKIDSPSPSSVKRKCIAFTSPIIWSILGYQVMRILFVFISYPCVFSEYFSLKINRLKINLYWCSFICYSLNMYMHVCVKSSLRKIDAIRYLLSYTDYRSVQYICLSSLFEIISLRQWCYHCWDMIYYKIIL